MANINIQEAIESFRNGCPTTASFRAIGLPFEAFLKYAQMSKDKQEAFNAAVVAFNQII